MKLLPLPESYKTLPPNVYKEIEGNARRGDKQLTLCRVGYAIAGTAAALVYLGILAAIAIALQIIK